MGYLIALIVVSMVLAPILWIMPSPTQKRQVAMRQKAMALGLQIKVCDLPQTRRQQVRGEQALQGVVYRLRCTPSLANSALPQALCFRQSDEASTEVQTTVLRLLKEALQDLPEDVMALEYDRGVLGAYWQERGDIPHVEQIFQQLQALNQELVAQAIDFSSL